VIFARYSWSVCSAQAATLLEFIVPLTNCFVRMWFCVVLGPKPPLHFHNWLSFGKFQDTKSFLIPCSRHVLSRLPPSGETCKYAMARITPTNLERFSTYWRAPFCCLSLLLRCRVRKFRKDLWIILYVRFEIYTVMEIHIIIFRVMALCCSVADRYRLFGVICWIQLQGWSWKQYISQRMRWTGHVTRMESKKCTRIVSVHHDGKKKTAWKIYK
jgi:hypothetical protein